jgi:hypothetical protein
VLEIDIGGRDGGKGGRMCCGAGDVGARTKWDISSPLGCISRHITNNVLNQSNINAMLYPDASRYRASIHYETGVQGNEVGSAVWRKINP